jgi:hypothetical protein
MKNLFESFYEKIELDTDTEDDFVKVFQTSLDLHKLFGKFSRIVGSVLNDNELDYEFNMDDEDEYDRGIRSFAKFIKVPSPVRKVDLGSNRISTFGAFLLKESFQQNFYVDTLILNDNYFFDEGACEIAELLEGNTALQEIDLSDNCIENHGFRDIAKALAKNCTLKKLNLSLSTFSVKTASTFSKSIRAHDSLQSHRVGFRSSKEI